MSAMTIERDQVLEGTMQAVIIYDDVSFAMEAKAMLESAAYRTGDTTAQWSVMPWRLAQLMSSPAADVALAEAMESHMIVLALRPSGSLPSHLSAWLETWAMRRHVPDVALAVFGGGNGGVFSAPATRELSEFAQRHRLSLILDDGGSVADESAFSISSLHEREVAVTSTLHDIMDEPIPGSYRGWGINE
jgi:hypothetical protein